MPSPPHSRSASAPISKHLLPTLDFLSILPENYVAPIIKPLSRKVQLPEHLNKHHSIEKEMTRKKRSPRLQNLRNQNNPIDPRPNLHLHLTNSNPKTSPNSYLAAAGQGCLPTPPHSKGFFLKSNNPASSWIQTSSIRNSPKLPYLHTSLANESNTGGSVQPPQFSASSSDRYRGYPYNPNDATHYSYYTARRGGEGILGEYYDYNPERKKYNSRKREEFKIGGSQEKLETDGIVDRKGENDIIMGQIGKSRKKLSSMFFSGLNKEHKDTEGKVVYGNIILGRVASRSRAASGTRSVNGQKSGELKVKPLCANRRYEDVVKQELKSQEINEVRNGIESWEKEVWGEVGRVIVVIGDKGGTGVYNPLTNTKAGVGGVRTALNIPAGAKNSKK
jgi:hypothetical protein